MGRMLGRDEHDPWSTLAKRISDYQGGGDQLQMHVLDLATLLIEHADEVMETLGSARAAYSPGGERRR